MDPKKDKELDSKRESSRISSMRYQERQRSRIGNLTRIQNDLQKKNETLRHENQMLRSIISSIKANNKNAVVSRDSTLNASPISTLPPTVSSHEAPILQALQNIQQQPQHQQQEVPREPTILCQALSLMLQAFQNDQNQSQYQQQELPREPTTPDVQQLHQTLAFVLEAFRNAQQKSQHQQQEEPAPPTTLNGQHPQLALLLQSFQNIRQDQQQELPTSPLFPIERQQLSQDFATALQTILNAQQEQQQRSSQPTSTFFSMWQPPLHQLPSSHLPPIQNSIVQSKLPTLSLAGSVKNPNTLNADPKTVQSPLDLFQSCSSLQQNLASGSALGAQSSIPQAQQQTLNISLPGSGQPLPGSTVFPSAGCKDNQADNLNDGPSLEQNFSGHIPPTFERKASSRNETPR
eukprot:scaffold918_cov126-Cylindrotheca_fusiformis.AAC.1